MHARYVMHFLIHDIFFCHFFWLKPKTNEFHMELLLSIAVAVQIPTGIFLSIMRKIKRK